MLSWRGEQHGSVDVTYHKGSRDESVTHLPGIQLHVCMSHHHLMIISFTLPPNYSLIMIDCVCRRLGNDRLCLSPFGDRTC